MRKRRRAALSPRLRFVTFSRGVACAHRWLARHFDAENDPWKADQPQNDVPRRKSGTDGAGLTGPRTDGAGLTGPRTDGTGPMGSRTDGAGPTGSNRWGLRPMAGSVPLVSLGLPIGGGIPYAMDRGQARGSACSRRRERRRRGSPAQVLRGTPQARVRAPRPNVCRGGWWARPSR